MVARTDDCVEELFNVRFETNKKSDGHALDSYKTLYSDLVAQLVERLTSVDAGISHLL